MSVIETHFTRPVEFCVRASFFPKRNKRRAFEVADRMVTALREAGYSFHSMKVEWDRDAKGYMVKVGGSRFA